MRTLVDIPEEELTILKLLIEAAAEELARYVDRAISDVTWIEVMAGVTAADATEARRSFVSSADFRCAMTSLNARALSVRTAASNLLTPSPLLRPKSLDEFLLRETPKTSL